MTLELCLVFHNSTGRHNLVTFLGHNEGALLAEPRLRRIRTRYVALLPCPVSVCFHTIQKLYCTDLKNLGGIWRL